MLCRASRASSSVTSAGGAAGGRASTITLVVEEAVNAGLRSSLAVQVMVIAPGCAPFVSKVAEASDARDRARRRGIAVADAALVGTAGGASGCWQKSRQSPCWDLRCMKSREDEVVYREAAGARSHTPLAAVSQVCADRVRPRWQIDRINLRGSIRPGNLHRYPSS